MKSPLHLMLTFTAVLLICHKTQGQNGTAVSKLWIEARGHYGFVAPHHDNIVHLTSQHFGMTELNLFMRTNGDNYWEQQHKYPLKGISFLYTDLGGNPYLGRAAAVIPYLNFQLTKGQKVGLWFRFGVGAGYLSRRFDRTENHKNIAIGSHFNAAIQMMYELRWRIVPRLDFCAGLGLTHFSNGAIKVPNLGINIFTLSSGLAYKLNRTELPRKVSETTEVLDRKWEFSAFAVFGFSELYAAYGPKYYAFMFSGSALKPIGHRGKRKIGIGLDISWDAAVVESMLRISQEFSHPAEAIRPGLSFTHRMDFSRLSILMQLGFYPYTKYKDDGYIYDRLALQYRFGKHYMIHLGLKTHLFKADMIEYGVGYRF